MEGEGEELSDVKGEWEKSLTWREGCIITFGEGFDVKEGASRDVTGMKFLTVGRMGFLALVKVLSVTESQTHVLSGDKVRTK